MRMANFHNLPPEWSAFDKAAYVILPVPYERTTSYMKGTEFGPQAIIEASEQLESFDDELGIEPYRAGIHTAPPTDILNDSPERQNEIIYQRWHELVATGKTIGMLGGEHSISYGAVRACLERHPDLTVLHLDAHADLRDGYLGDRFSHAAAMRRVHDLTDKTISVGIRSFSIEEHEYINERGIKIFSADHLNKRPQVYSEIVDELAGDLYLTFDLDVFDPSIMPAVGTPEPGGLGWYQVLGLLKSVIEKCNLVGFDLVELMPIGGCHAAAFTAAKVVYKIIGYDYYKKLK